MRCLAVAVTYTLSTYDPDFDFDAEYSRHTALMISDLLPVQCRVLEIGCATGIATEILARHGRRVVAVERDRAMIERAKGRSVENVVWCWQDVMTLTSDEHYDAILCCSVLHELADPRLMLRHIAHLASTDTRVMVTVPSALSLHYNGVPRLGERARKFGVRRLLTPQEWHTLLISFTGLRVAERWEFFLKPYEQAQMACLSPTVVDHLGRYRGPGGALAFFDLRAT